MRERIGGRLPSNREGGELTSIRAVIWLMVHGGRSVKLNRWINRGSGPVPVLNRPDNDHKSDRLRRARPARSAHTRGAFAEILGPLHPPRGTRREVWAVFIPRMWVSSSPRVFHPLADVYVCFIPLAEYGCTFIPPCRSLCLPRLTQTHRLPPPRPVHCPRSQAGRSRLFVIASTRPPFDYPMIAMWLVRIGRRN